MKRIIFMLLIAFSFSLKAQPFQIGSTVITFIDSSRSNRAITTEIYYPSATAGSNVPIASAGLKENPLVVFGHGFLMTVGAYQNIWSVLVANGYVVALPRTEGGLLPNHTNFGKDLAFVANAIQENSKNQGNVFYNAIAAKTAVMGHSMGGGAAFLSIQYNNKINAIVGLAPAETNPNASIAASSIVIPGIVFAGENDCVTPAAQHSQLIYNSLASTCKTYISIKGGSHCQFANSNFNCSLGESTCSPSPTISRATQHAIVSKYLVPWLNYRLKENCQQGFLFQSELASDPTITNQNACSNFITCKIPVGRKTTNVTTNSALLSWDNSLCKNNYVVRYKKAGSSFWSITNPISTNSFFLSNLTSSTTYNWAVRVQCDSAGTSLSGYGTTKVFTTLSNNFRSDLSTDIDNNLNLAVFPNPSDGIFDLKIESKSNAAVLIEVYNSIGELEHSEKLDAAVEGSLLNKIIDLRSRPTGIYVLKVTDGKEVYAERILKY